MRSITLHSRVGQDGVLKLSVPVGLRDAELEVVVIIQPVVPPGVDGWLPGFFEETFGCLRGAPLARESQGEYEVRSDLP